MQEWDRAVLRNAGRYAQWPAAVHESGSTLKSPATEEQVLAAEERLGVTLPPSYRAFLLQANGTYGRDGHAGLWPVEHVLPLVEAEPLWLECTTMPELNDPANDVCEEPGPWDVGYFLPMRSGLQIGGDGESAEVLVPRAGKTEWEYWTLFKEGAVAWASLEAFLSTQVRELQWADPALAARYEADAQGLIERPSQAGGDEYQAFRNLTEVDPPAALRICAQLLEPAFDGIYVQENILGYVGMMGSPELNASLMALLSRASRPELRWRILGALDRCGAGEAPALIAAAAETETDPAFRSWCARRAAELGL